EVVGQAPAADRDQLDAAVTAARRAAAGWRALDVAERVAAVAAAAGSAAEQLAVSDGALLYTREHGKVLAEARFEIDTGPAVVSLLGAIAEAALAPERIDPQSDYPRLQREPYGVAALVLPFNWPLALTMTKLSSALAAGNTAVVKVPPTCPLAALRLGAALAAALPPGVVNILAGPGSELAQALVTHPGIDVISLTGGVATGRAVMAAAAPRLTPVLLELGGNDAAIIAPDITLTDQLVDQLVTATYTTCGQVCMAIKRLYVPAGQLAGWRDALAASLSRVVVGDGLRSEVTMGPVHTEASRDRVEAMIAEAADSGAEVVRPGTVVQPDCGWMVSPALVVAPDPKAALVRQEQFAPALPLLPYQDIDLAVAAANDTEFGLCASIWSGDAGLAEAVAQRLDAGTVWTNAHGMGAMDHLAPMGGWGESGLGTELGVEGMSAFTRPRVLRHGSL
ncbi:MAG: aldehyde dehydrogenase family protein, partial [Mycobacterium sp.]